MKMKSMVAALAASAIAISAMAVSASAAITNANSGDKYELVLMGDGANNLPDGCKLTDVYGFEAKISALPGEGENCIGALCWQSDSNDWEQKEFGKADDKKDLAIGDDGVIKYVAGESLFKEDDTWAKAFVAEWNWDKPEEDPPVEDGQIDFNVEYFKLLDKDGNELTAKEAETTTTTEEKKDDATTTTSTTKKASGSASGSSNSTTSAKTGDAGVGVAVAALGLAGAAAFTARKKH